jgi:hypothetical protein
VWRSGIGIWRGVESGIGMLERCGEWDRDLERCEEAG